MNPINKARKAKETLRTYGPAERREWMTSFCCVVCNAPPKSQQSHLRSRSGAGRKGDADKVVPMCGPCHRLYPQRSKWRERYPLWPDARLEEAARAFDEAWRVGSVQVQLRGDLYWG